MTDEEMGAMAERVRTIAEDMVVLKTFVIGDDLGRGGARTRLTRLEDIVRLLSWAVGLILAAVLTTTATMGTKAILNMFRSGPAIREAQGAPPPQGSELR